MSENRFSFTTGSEVENLKTNFYLHLQTGGNSL